MIVNIRDSRKIAIMARKHGGKDGFVSLYIQGGHLHMTESFEEPSSSISLGVDPSERLDVMARGIALFLHNNKHLLNKKR